MDYQFFNAGRRTVAEVIADARAMIIQSDEVKAFGTPTAIDDAVELRKYAESIIKYLES